LESRARTGPGRVSIEAGQPVLNMVKVGFYVGNVRMLIDVFKVSSLALMFFFLPAGLEIFYFGLTFIGAFEFG